MPKKFRSRETEVNFYTRYLREFTYTLYPILTFTPNIPPYETAISFCEIISQVALRKKDFFSLKRIYFLMALFADVTGKSNPHPLLRKSKEYELMELSNQRKKNRRIQILASANGCENCQEHDGRKLTTEEALATMPLPHASCTYSNYNDDYESHGFCRCEYSLVFK